MSAFISDNLFNAIEIEINNYLERSKVLPYT